MLEIALVSTRLGLTSFGGPVAHLGYFRAEYVAHVERKECPAGVCRMGTAQGSGAAAAMEVHA